MMRKWCDNDSNCDNDAFSYDSTREEEEDCLSIGSRWSASFLPNKVSVILILIIFWIVDFDFVTSRHSFGAEDRAGLTITTIWLSQLSDYHNYLTIWQSQQSDASCQIYRLTKEQPFDSTLSKHLTDTWYFGCMVFCHIYDKCWFQPFNAIGRIIWRSQLQKKSFQCHSIAIYSYMICFIKCRWNNLS